MRQFSEEQKNLIESSSYKVDYRVYIEDQEGDWLDLTSLEGYDWVDGLDISSDIDNPVKQGSIRLYRNFYYLSLSPSVRRSKLNRTMDEDEEYFMPLLNVSRKMKVEVAVFEEGTSPHEDDYIELFRGETQNVQWGGEEPFIEVPFNCMLARVRDAFLEEETTYGGIGMLTESVDEGQNEVTVKYEEEIELALDAIKDEDKEKTWSLRASAIADPPQLWSETATLTVEPGEKLRYFIYDETGVWSSEAYIEDPDGNKVLTDADVSGTESKEIMIDEDNAGTWTAYANTSVSTLLGSGLYAFEAEYPIIKVGSDAIISNITEDEDDSKIEKITIIEAERQTPPEEDEEHIYTLTLEEGLENSYDKISRDDGVTTGSFVGLRVENEMNRILQDVTFGYEGWEQDSDGWSVELFLEHAPEFVVGATELGHENALDALENLASQLGWVLEYRWQEETEDFEFTLRDPERYKVTSPPAGLLFDDTHTGEEIQVRHLEYFEVGDTFFIKEDGVVETDVIKELDPATIFDPFNTVILEEGLDNEYTSESTIAVVDYTITPDNLINVRNVEVEKADIRNVCRTKYKKDPLADVEDEEDLDDVVARNNESIREYGYLYTEITQKATPNVAGKAFAKRLSQSVVDDLSYPKADQEIEIRFFPYIQQGDVLVIEPTKELYDTPQIVSVTGFSHNLSEGTTTIRTRQRPIGGFKRWHKAEVRPGNAPAVRSPSRIANLNINLSLEKDDDGEPKKPPKYKAEIEWSRNNEEISHYELRYKKENDEAWTHRTTETPGYKVENLDSASAYTFEVRVIVKQGGEYSETRRSDWTSVTEELTPFDPENVDGLTANDRLQELKDGTKTTVVDVYWEEPDAVNYSHATVMYREGEYDEWAGVGKASNTLTFNPSVQDETIEIIVVPENYEGDKLSITKAEENKYSLYVEGKTDKPESPEWDKDNIEWRPDEIKLAWIPIESKDLKDYIVRTDPYFEEREE